MEKDQEKLRMVLKFDTGADGFLKMMAVLAVSAVLLLAVGVYFLNMVMRDMRQLS